MRHVITGGSGFVGSYLALALAARGEKVTVFDTDQPKVKTSKVDFLKGDIRKPEDLRKLNLDTRDIVYHFASRQFHSLVPRFGRDDWFADVNVEGTRMLLNAMSIGSSRHLIFFSTDMIYGMPKFSPVPPTHPLKPLGPYGRSKVAAEQLLFEARLDFGLRASVFRPRLIVGAGRLGILTKLFELIRIGMPVPLVGDGRNRYQMIAVEDCVAASLAAVSHGCPEGPFNLGSLNPPTVRLLLQRVIKLAGSRSIVMPVPAAPMKFALKMLDLMGLTLLYPEQFGIANVDYVLDTERTRAALNWTPSKNDSDILFAAYQDFLNT